MHAFNWGENIDISFANHDRSTNPISLKKTLFNAELNLVFEIMKM